MIQLPTTNHTGKGLGPAPEGLRAGKGAAEGGAWVSARGSFGKLLAGLLHSLKQKAGGAPEALLPDEAAPAELRAAGRGSPLRGLGSKVFPLKQALGALRAEMPPDKRAPGEPAPEEKAQDAAQGKDPLGGELDFPPAQALSPELPPDEAPRARTDPSPQETAQAGAALTETAPKAAPGGAEQGEKPETAEARPKKSQKPVLELRDFRSPQAGNSAVQGELRVSEERVNARGETELVVELRGGGQNRPEPAAGEGRPAQAFEDILARELHQNLNNDIVRHASIALRDNNEGTIRLSLKPESLGHVKIRLEMSENRIAGHIIVESGEALRAFEREIHTLEQAFRDSGFDAASLKMAVASDGRRESPERQWKEAKPFYSGRFAASGYDTAGEGSMAPSLVPGQINMLA